MTTKKRSNLLHYCHTYNFKKSTVILVGKIFQYSDISNHEVSMKGFEKKIEI